MAKYIFITGGVVSALGKGIAAASLGALLQARSYSVILRKMDPYINIDPGTMSPLQHGEVYITEDGSETDLDLGHYERFTGITSSSDDNITAGNIYSQVIKAERKGEYLGSTVQVIPHITDAIKSFIRNKVSQDDIVICEIGGTVGDIECLPFLEAVRQIRNEEVSQDTLFIHLTLVPWINSAGELKTKPTQHSVKELQGLGIQPDILLCRCDRRIDEHVRKKISLFCNLPLEAVIEAIDTDVVYEIPLLLHESGLDEAVCKNLSLGATVSGLDKWRKIVRVIKQPEARVSIAIIGKYTGLFDSYKSLSEALCHGGIDNNVGVNIEWLDSSIFDGNNLSDRLQGICGILVPGGFGERGSEGKIAAITFAREHKIPYLGICLGMQLAVVEVARNLTDIEDACSAEFCRCRNPVIDLIRQWSRGDNVVEYREEGEDLGGTMRLGLYPCHLVKNSRAYNIFAREVILERHRHRYEVNKVYADKLEQAGLFFSGWSPDGLLPEILEMSNHPWFMGVQFHPEFTSRPFAPHPLFSNFIKAALEHSRLL